MYTGYLPADIYNNALWMSWNIFLAVIPFLLAWHLFKPGQKKTFFWSIGVLAFFLFLPNAPYIFTDLIHYREHLEVISRKRDLAVATSQFLVFIAIGYICFVESYRRFERFIMGNLYQNHRYFARLVSFMTVSFGVYLGRFMRFNSWDVLTEPMRILGTARMLNDIPVISFVFWFTLLLSISYLIYEQTLNFLFREQE